MTKSELRKALTAAKRASKQHQKKYVQNHTRYQKAKRAVQTWEHEMNFHAYEQKKADLTVSRLSDQLAALAKSKRRV